MCDPVTAATGIKAVDAAINVARTVHSIITAMANASEELLWVLGKLAQFESLMQQLSILRQSYSGTTLFHESENNFRLLHSIADRSTKDILKLQSLLGKPIRKQDRPLCRVYKMFRYPFKRLDITEISSRLDNHISLATSVLSAIGRHSDLMNYKAITNVNHALKEQLGIQTRLDSSVNYISSKVDSQTSDIRAHMSFSRNPFSVIQKGSAVHAATALSVVQPHIVSLLRCRENSTSPDSSRRSLEDGYHKLLQDAYRLGVQELDFVSPIRRMETGPSRPNQPLAIQACYHSSKQRFVIECNLDLRIPVHEGTTPRSTEVEIHKDVAVGRIRLSFPSKPRRRSKHHYQDGFRLLFVPKMEFGISGVAAAFMRAADSSMPVPPSISTFGVVSIDSPVIHAIQQRNLSAVRESFSSGVCSSQDRDGEGNSLLQHAIKNYSYDMCRLLLEQGADAMECTRSGDSALISFLRCGTLRDFPDSPHDSECVRAVRLFVDYCGLDVYTVSEDIDFFGRRSPGEDGPLAFLIGLIRSGHGDLEVLRYLAYNDCDLEEPDAWGNTALLRAAWTPKENLVVVMRLLLQAGANPRALNSHGHGVINMLFVRFTSCYPVLSEAEANSLTELFVEFIRLGVDPRHRSKDAVPLIDCASFPSAWVIWCRALVATGHDIEDILRDQDRIHGSPSPSNDAVLASLGDLETPSLVPHEFFEKQPAGSGASTSREHVFRFPFDMLRVSAAEPAEAHCLRWNHADGYPCSNFMVSRSCSRGDHDFGGFPYMTEQHRSSRRWAMYYLWRHGYLETVDDAHEWAADVMTVDALDSWGHLANLKL